MPTLNVRLAAIILVSLIVGGGGVHLVHGLQVSRQARTLKTASEQAEKDKDFSEAIRLLDSYYRLVPNDRGTELHLGMLYADIQQLQKANECLEDALRLADKSNPPVPPEDVRQARRRLVKDVEMKLGSEAHLAALEHLQTLLEGAVEKNARRGKGEKPVGDPELLDLYAQILTTSLKGKEACDIFQDVIALAPHEVDYYTHFALARLRLDQKTEADATIELMLANNPNDVAAYERYVEYFLMRNKRELAAAKASELQKKLPDDPRSQLLIGRCYAIAGDAPKAEEYLLKGLKSAKGVQGVVAYKLLARAQNQLGKTKEAVETLKQGREATKGQLASFDLLWEMANIQVFLRDLAGATENVKTLRDVRYPPYLVDYLDVQIAIQQQDWPKVKRLLLESVIPKGIEPSFAHYRATAYVYLAQCYRQEMNEPEQMAALQKAVAIDPTMLHARSMMAEIYASHGNLQDAAEQYQLAAKGPQAADAGILLARTLVRIRMNTDPAKRDWKDVDNLIDRLLREMPDRPDIVALKAESLLSQNKDKEAAAVLEECTKQRPKNIEAWLTLVQLDLHEASKEDDPAKKAALWKKAGERITEAEKNVGDRAIMRMARGSLALVSKDPHVTDALKRLGENVDALGDAEKLQLWNNLANMSYQAGDVDLCRSYFRRITEKEPKNVPVRSRLCELQLSAFEKGQPVDAAELDRLVNEIEQLSGQGPSWLYAKAIREVVQSKSKDPQILSQARKDLQKAMDTRKDWAAPVVLAGKVCELQDEPDLALEFYIRAIRSFGEWNNDIISRTVRLLVPRGRIDEAKMVFDLLEKQKSPLLEEMRQEYVDVKVLRGPINDAVKEVEKSVAADSKDFKGLQRQGQMYAYLAYRLKYAAQKSADPKQPDSWKNDADMLAMARRSTESLFEARKLNPQAEEVWTTLAQLFAEMGQAEQAKPLIPQMERTLTSESALTTVAHCCELLGEPAKAEENYLKAAKAFPRNCRILRQLAGYYLRVRKIDSAEPQLRAIISLETPAAATDACWARRSLAAILMARGDFDNRRDALELIEDNIRKLPSAGDQRLKITLLLADPRREKINDAIAALESMADSPDATPEDHFRLAQLYLKKEERQAYEKQMHIVLGSPRVQPWHLISYIVTLMDSKDFNGADSWLQSMENSVRDPSGPKSIRFEPMPGNFEVVRLRAEYLFRQARYAEAANKLQTYFDSLDTQTASRGQQISFAAELLESFGNRLKAEHKPDLADFMTRADSLFRSLKSPKLATNGGMLYATFLGRQKRIDESLDQLEPAWDKKDPEFVQVPALAIISSRAATPAQCARLEKIVQSAQQVNRSTNLLMVLAALHEQQRQYPQAIQDYRDVLAKEPQNFKALNNLAVLLVYSGGNANEALSLVNRALALSGPVAAVCDSKALVHMALDQPEKALEDVNAAIENDGTSDQYFHQACVLNLLGRKSDAAVAFKKALDMGLDPKFLHPYEITRYERLKDMM